MQPTPPVEITVSRHFLTWLHEEKISLAFTTYQTNRLFLVGLKPDGNLSTFERLFDRPMGLYTSSERLYMSTRAQLWRLENTLPAGEEHDGYDRVYVPRSCQTTGDLDVHDVVLDREGKVVFVNTLYSCLATLDENYSFAPLWRPPFISRLAAEDRCHLNGLAMENGAPRYVTAVSRSDVPAGWRDRREKGGCLVDVSTDEILLGDLSMPHSPRLYQDKVWLLNSGCGELGYYDPGEGQFNPVAFCPGYLRGLAFHGNYAVVGLSKQRREKAFQGLELDQKLENKDAAARCGLYVVDLRSGDIAHWAQVEGVVLELYDVGVLEGVRRPMALGFKTNEIDRLITYNDGSGLKFTVLAPTQEQTDTRRPPAVPTPHPEPVPTRADTSQERYHFRLSQDMSLDAALHHFDQLLFPEFALRAPQLSLHQPLLALLALSEEKPAGLLVAERLPVNASVHLRSLFVVPEHRQQGLATEMVRRLEAAMLRQDCPYLECSYDSTWNYASVVEDILASLDWPRPQVLQYRYQGQAKAIPEALPFAETSLPSGFTIFPWQELSAADREAIHSRQKAESWYPLRMDPFQEEESRELENSIGLRFQEQVVGWLVTHRNHPDIVQYRILFVSNEFPASERTGLIIPLIAQAFQRQAFADIPLYLFQVDGHDQTIMDITRLYLEPLAQVTAIIKQNRKLLHPSPGNTSSQ
jgi:uncharacterized protein (TIGR03032 family)